MKIRQWRNRAYMHCPGCNMSHAVLIDDEHGWRFNGDAERPTFEPSILVTWNEGVEQTPQRCHSFVRDGQWQFLSDCTHPLAGQTVDIPDVS